MRAAGVVVLATMMLGATACSGSSGGADSVSSALTSSTPSASPMTSTGGSTTATSTSSSASTSTTSTRSATTSRYPSSSTSTAATSSTARSTRTFGPTTEPGPKPPTDPRPQDCTFATALGSTSGKTFKGVTCKAAQEVWRRYTALPPDPAAGNTNHRELSDGWICYAPTAASAVTDDEGGICERKAQKQKFVLHYTQD